VSTAQELPLAFGEPAAAPTSAPALRLVPAAPLDFDDAVRRVRPRLHRYAVRRLGDSHEAEELVQEALLRAYTHREQLLTEDDLSAWTTVVTGRLVIDRLRVRGRSTSVADVPESSRLSRDTADVVVARDEARTALDALDAMPARQAAVLWAREVEGHSYEQLCVRFQMTEPAVRSVLTRARKALRKEYAHRGGTLPVGGLAVLAPWIAGLTGADKVRRAAGRVTAPAALATIGITVLGGLVLSPFGAATAPGTFTPKQAIVAGNTSSTTAGASSAALPRTGAGTVALPGTGASGSAHRPAGLHALTQRPLKPLTRLPCSSTPALVQTPGVRDLPTGVLAVGGSACRPTTNRVSLSVPGGAATGYNELSFESRDVPCSQVSPVTTVPASPVQCTSTQETQR
jgi:RNA polymerase sigma factor (sigma-70 family)